MTAAPVSTGTSARLTARPRVLIAADNLIVPRSFGSPLRSIQIGSNVQTLSSRDNSPRMPTRRTRALMLLALALALGAAYWTGLRAPFQFDDVAAVVENAAI